MALLPELWISFAAALFAIIFGIFVEKHYVSAYSALPNAFSLAVTLMSFSLINQKALIGLGVYSIIMIAFSLATLKFDLKGMSGIMAFAGSKVTGSVLFVLALAENKILLNPTDAQMLLFASIFTIIVVQVIGYIISTKIK